MNTSGIKIEATASLISFTNSMLVVNLQDGREIRIPLKWFPSLENATQEQRENWRIIGKGQGIHWKDLDEDLSVSGLLLGNKPDITKIIDK